jgi:Na+/H+ antiporter NhaD/arsenite permease-like protein
VISEKINRSIIALLGAFLVIALGVLDQERAIAGIDFNIISLWSG